MCLRTPNILHGCLCRYIYFVRSPNTIPILLHRARFRPVATSLFNALEQSIVNYHFVFLSISKPMQPACTSAFTQHTTHTHTVWLLDRPTFNISAYRVPFPITRKYDPAIQQHLNVYIYKYYHTKLPYISFNTKYYFFALLAFYFTICGRRSAVIPCVAP